MIVERHPLLDLRAFITAFPRPLGDIPPTPEILALLSLQTEASHPPSPPLGKGGTGVWAPLQSDDAVREAVRVLLRHGGFKPSGRSKPASEYLIRAVGAGALSSINAAVDVCNVVSLHSGLPISVVDLNKAKPPFRAAVAPAGSSYVFNASGQEIDLAGLLCLYDADGPCGNAVKDAQRTKTDAGTTQTLTVIWGATALPGRAAHAETWYRQLLNQLGASTMDVELQFT
jgi:DNA/RNA-binding domain of Phe-tRNA-synthetase-like protein